MGLPPVVVGLIVYMLLSNAGPLGFMGLLYSPTAMIIAQAILILPIIAALSRQVIEDLHQEYAEQFRALCVPTGRGDLGGGRSGRRRNRDGGSARRRGSAGGR